MPFEGLSRRVSEASAILSAPSLSREIVENYQMDRMFIIRKISIRSTRARFRMEYTGGSPGCNENQIHTQ